MSEKHKYDSRVCTCGHPKGNHYKKNYLLDDATWKYGNVDFNGCDGIGDKNCECKFFTPTEVPSSIYGFEAGFEWMMDSELREIYKNEIYKKTWFTPWFKENKERYSALLKERAEK
jgi:hypothetical protein